MSQQQRIVKIPHTTFQLTRQCQNGGHKPLQLRVTVVFVVFEYSEFKAHS